MPPTIQASKSNSYHYKNSHDYELIATAYHEAGHVVIGTLNLFKIEYAHIEIDSKLSGVTKWLIMTMPNDSVLNREIIQSEIISLAAGPIAENQYYRVTFGKTLPRSLKRGASSDIKNINSIIINNAFANPGKERNLYKKMINDISKDLIEKHWPTISAVAHLLYRKKKVSENIIRATMVAANNTEWPLRFKLIDEIFTFKKK